MKSCGIFKLGQWRKLFISFKSTPFAKFRDFWDIRKDRFCIFKLVSFGNNGKSLNKWKRCYRAWPTSTVHPGLDQPTSHLAIFFSSASTPVHWAEATDAPGFGRDRCHRSFAPPMCAAHSYRIHHLDGKAKHSFPSLAAAHTPPLLPLLSATVLLSCRRNCHRRRPTSAPILERPSLIVELVPHPRREPTSLACSMSSPPSSSPPRAPPQ
jgi:hypothetical protein